MNEDILNFIDEAIQLELGMAKLYNLFAEKLKEDHDFWARLEIEERNHAALLHTGRDFVKFNRFPDKILPDQAGMLEESNRFVEKCLSTFEKETDRETAFNLAIELEKSAGEAHFQKFMDSREKDSLTNIFQQLNRADKDHVARILAYWQESNILKGQ